MNPRYKTQYNWWHDEVAKSKNQLGGGWAPLDFGCYTPNLIRWLCTTFPIRNVVDVGCGTGEALRAFRTHGCQVMGIEGLQAACQYTDVNTLCHDMEKGPLKLFNVDLIFSIEFVEHVENVANIVDTFICGKMIVMSAAGPGKGGHHHVNCQPQEYWVEKFIQKGFRYLKELSEKVRVLDTSYFSSTGMIFLEDGVDWGTCIGNYKEEP